VDGGGVSGVRVGGEMTDAPAPETEVSAALKTHLDRLSDEGRCVYYSEVWVNAWTHSLKKGMDRLRIDFVAQFDGGPPVGIEVKRRPEQPVELGRALLQCSQYAQGVIATQAAERVAPSWLGQPLKAVFLRVDQAGMRESIRQHASAAVRLYGPANVGFLYVTQWNGLNLNIGGDRWWCERWGYRANAMDRTSRTGNGNWKPEV